MPHPWSKMSKEEFAHRQRMLRRVSVGMCILVVALLVVQSRLTFSQTSGAMEASFAALNATFAQAGAVLEEPVSDGERLFQLIGDKIKSAKEVDAARRAVIEQMAANLPEPAPPGANDSDAWTYREPSPTEPYGE